MLLNEMCHLLHKNFCSLSAKKLVRSAIFLGAIMGCVATWRIHARKDVMIPCLLCSTSSKLYMVKMSFEMIRKLISDRSLMSRKFQKISSKSGINRMERIGLVEVFDVLFSFFGALLSGTKMMLNRLLRSCIVQSA